MRLVIALLLAPIAPILVYSLFSFFPSIVETPVVQFPYLARSLFEALAVAYGLAAFAGAPTLVILKRREKFTQQNTVATGAAIAALIPVALEAYRLAVMDGEAKYSYIAEGCQVIIENVRSKCGYMLMLKEMIIFAAVGAAVALVFWYLQRRRERPAD